jgi:hypothetical protein
MQRFPRLILALFLMLLPAIAFDVILWKNAVGIPIFDDYDVVLRGINTISVHPGFLPKLICWMTLEHNGYKLMLENAIVLGQCSLFGHVNFLPLVEVGNAFAFLIFLIVCSMSRVAPGDLGRKAILLVPVAYLLFQLQYWEALDFASSSLQVLTVIFFSLLSIYLLCRDSRWPFAFGCIALVFAIASSPSGFFVMPVGLLILVQFRRWRRMPAWIGVVVLMLAVYLFRYVRPAGGPTHFSILYALNFLGSSPAHHASLALGLILCGVFIISVMRRYYKQNPAIFYSTLLILITAIAVSYLRSDLGIAQSLAPRYRIHSSLFLVFSYMFLVENMLPLLKRKSLRRGILTGAGVLSVAFCVLCDAAGTHNLEINKRAFTYIYRVEWMKDPSAVYDAEVKKQVLKEINAGASIKERQMYPGDFENYEVDVPVMQESVRLGLYRPPQDTP